MVNKSYCWDFKEFFSSDEEFLKSLDEFVLQIDKVKEKLKDFSLTKKLEEYYFLSLFAEKLVTYAELHSDLDMSNETYLQYKNQVYTEKAKLDFIKNNINEEILEISIPLDEYLEKYPELKPFCMHLYEVLRTKNHLSSSSTITNENVLIQQVNSLYNTLMNVEFPCHELEIEEKKVLVNRNLYQKYISSKDRNLRSLVFKAFMNSLKDVNKSVSGLFSLRYQMCYDVAKEKGYSTILEQVISEDDLDIRIIDNLISCVHDNFSLLQRYLQLKKKNLGVGELHYYDLNIHSDYNPKYDFDSALEIVKDALKVMGDSYLEKVEEVLNGGILDVFPAKHKFGGGYHFRNYTKPMILMNYKNNFREVPTIAHEIGHAVNGLMIKDKHSFQDFHFSIFLSEIASTVNEDRVEEYFYQHASDDDKIIHLEQIIDKMITAIFFQTLFLEFQRNLCDKIEAGESLNADIISQTYLSLATEYYQGMTIDEELQYFWQTRMHFFFGDYRYYNFQYATGKIASLVINKNIDEGKLDDYLSFLSVGGSMPTLEALRVAGVDLTKKEIFQNAMDKLNILLDDYELLLNR